MPFKFLTLAALLCLTVLTAAQQPTPTAPPTVVTAVNGTQISAEAFRTRVALEAWLITREIGGFAEVFYASTPDAEQLGNAVSAVYGAQIDTLSDPDRFAGTVLNSMEVDALLAGLAADREIEVVPETVEALMLDHIARAEGGALAVPTATAEPDEIPTPAASPPALETNPLLTDFFAAAEAATGATEADVRALFRGRALREVFYRAVTGGGDDLEQAAEQNQLFQEWALAQVRSADITRADDPLAFVPEVDYLAALQQAVEEAVIGVALP